MFGDLSTPALLVDVEVFLANVDRGAARAQTLGVDLRPHAKTVKSPELLQHVMDRGAVGLTASTLGEIRALKSIASDLMYAVPVAAGKEGALLDAVGDDDIRVTVVVDELANLAGIPDDARIDVAIEVDSDGHRGGIAPDAPGLLELAERVAARHVLRGVMTHAGGSYLVERDEVPSVASAEREAVRTASRRLRTAGHAVEVVSVGSTPTMAAVDHLDGVTEARPGVFLFGDLSMVALGACTHADLALSTLATVIGSTQQGEVSLIDAGWSALSQDPGVAALGGETGIGVVVAAGAELADSHLVVSHANQEHGFVRARSGGPTRLRTGSRVRVLPNHACATAEMHQEMILVSGEAVVGRVDRPRGW